MPQAEFFQPMTLEAFQTFTNYKFAQAQAQDQSQTQVGQGQFPTLPMTPFVLPLAQLVVKLFKLVKEAR